MEVKSCMMDQRVTGGAQYPDIVSVVRPPVLNFNYVVNVEGVELSEETSRPQAKFAVVFFETGWAVFRFPSFFFVLRFW